MRLFVLLLAAALSIAGPGLAQTRERPVVSIVVQGLDQLRQIQDEYGRNLLRGLGDADWGPFTYVAPPIAADLVRSCRDERMDRRLDYCVRFHLTRAELPADAAPTVILAFDDRPWGAPEQKGPGEMRVTCFGRGVAPTDAAVQSTWLWPDAARMHGVNDWNRDRDALAACIAAAAAEPWTGLRQPDVD